MRESNWYKINACAKCTKKLANSKVYYNGGVCPHCGYDSNSDICDSIAITVKETKHYPWWQIFNRKKPTRVKMNLVKCG